MTEYATQNDKKYKRMMGLGSLIPWPSKHETVPFEFDCPVHGKQRIEVARWRADEYKSKDPKTICPECRRIEEERQREEDRIENLRIESLSTVTTLKRIITIDKRLPDATFDNYEATTPEQRRMLAICKRFADNFVKRIREDHNAEIGLLLMGNYGTGKSHIASAIVRSVSDQRWGCFYMTASDLFDYINSVRSFDTTIPDLLDKISAIRLLVIDEIGVQSWTDAERKRLQQVIDERERKKHPTIFCTNLTQDEIKTCCGGRVESRLLDVAYPIPFEWEDHRRKNASGKSQPEDVF